MKNYFSFYIKKSFLLFRFISIFGYIFKQFFLLLVPNANKTLTFKPQQINEPSENTTEK